MRRVCFYHAGCPDGFGAAWSVRRAWGDGASYVPRGHNDVIRHASYEGAEVVFVDIAPPPPDLRALVPVVGQLLVLDHHLSSRDRYDSDPGLENIVAAAGHEVRFDLSHSGAVLAWDHFHPEEPTPARVRSVEDQDLGRWKLPDSEAVNAAIGSYARDFETWDHLAERSIERLAEEGAPILRAQRIEVERALEGAHPVQVRELRVEAVNSRFVRSAIGHELAKRARHGVPAGLVYRVTGRRVDVTLYSIGDFDVAAIAATLGGGGHRNAAGFHVSLAEWLAEFL